MVGGLLLSGLAGSSRTQRNRVRVAWREAATRLGLELDPWELRLQGRLDGHRVHVVVHVRKVYHKGRTREVAETRFALRFERPLPVSLRLRLQSAVDSLKAMFGFSDLELGDPSFDRLVKVQGESAQEIRAFLDAERRHAVASFLEAHPSGQIDDQAIQVVRYGYVRSPEHVVTIAEAMRQLASALTTGRPPDAEAVTGAGPASPPLRRPPVAAETEAPAEAPATPLTPELLPPMPAWMAEQAVRLQPDEDQPRGQPFTPHA